MALPARMPFRPAAPAVGAMIGPTMRPASTALAEACQHGSMATVFSKIINGEFSGLFAWADERCVAISTIAPISDGHLMVIPRAEVASFTSTDDELLAHLIRVAAIIGRAQEQAFDAPRAALIIAGFEVPHLHLHVLPAWGEAELSFEHARPGVPVEELAANTEKVRAVLRAQGHGANVPTSIDKPDLES